MSTKYRDKIIESHGLNVGEYVGCALDRIGGDISENEIVSAIEYYHQNEQALKEEAINERRETIKNYILSQR